MKLRIIDTGLYSKDLTTRETDANRAGYTGSSVTYIELNVKDITRNAGNNQNNDPQPGQFVTPDNNFVSFKTPVYTLNCVAPKDTTYDGSYQYGYLYQLQRLEKTKGIKLLYPDSDDDMLNLIWINGQYNAVSGNFASELSSNKYIAGRVQISNLRDNSSSSNQFKFDINFYALEDIED